MALYLTLGSTRTAITSAPCMETVRSGVWAATRTECWAPATRIPAPHRPRFSLRGACARNASDGNPPSILDVAGPGRGADRDGPLRSRRHPRPRYCDIAGRTFILDAVQASQDQVVHGASFDRSLGGLRRPRTHGRRVRSATPGT